MSTTADTITDEEYDALPILDDVCFYTIEPGEFEFACGDMEEVSIRVMNCETRREAWQQVRQMFDLIAKKGALLAVTEDNGKLVFRFEDNDTEVVEDVEEQAVVL